MLNNFPLWPEQASTMAHRVDALYIFLLIVTGMLVVASALGMRSALADGPGSTWAAWLIGLYGVGLIGAGIFAADPAYGFPPGTPADAHNVSFHGLMPTT